MLFKQIMRQKKLPAGRRAGKNDKGLFNQVVRLFSASH